MQLTTATTLAGHRLVIHATTRDGRYAEAADRAPYAVFCVERHEYVAGPFWTRTRTWFAMRSIAKNGLPDTVQLRVAKQQLLEAAKGVISRWEKSGLAQAVNELATAIAEVEAADKTRRGVTTIPPVIRMRQPPLSVATLRRMQAVDGKVQAIVEVDLEDLVTLPLDEIQDLLSERIAGAGRALSRMDYKASLVAPLTIDAVVLEVTAGLVHWDEIEDPASE